MQIYYHDRRLCIEFHIRAKAQHALDQTAFVMYRERLLVGGRRNDFGLVLPVGTDSVLGPRVLSHFRGGLSSAVAHGGGTMPITVSVRVALYPEAGTSAGGSALQG